MLNNFRMLKSGMLDNVDDSKLYPLLRWTSGSEKDLNWCNEVNKQFFWVDKSIMKGLLYLGINNRGIGKYPKSGIEKDKKFDFRKALIKQYFKWSEQEFWRNYSVTLNLNIETIAKELGIKLKKGSV